MCKISLSKHLQHPCGHCFAIILLYPSFFCSCVFKKGCIERVSWVLRFCGEFFIRGSSVPCKHGPGTASGAAKGLPRSTIRYLFSSYLKNCKLPSCVREDSSKWKAAVHSRWRASEKCWIHLPRWCWSTRRRWGGQNSSPAATNHTCSLSLLRQNGITLAVIYVWVPNSLHNTSDWSDLNECALPEV